MLVLLLSVVTILAQTQDPKSPDGPISVNLGDVYKKGNTKIEQANLTALPSLPRGYTAIPGMSYSITTDAVAVGPHTVVFGVSSITDEAIFNSLRVLHAEPDKFDPDSRVWIDRTAGDSKGPDFQRKTITAYSDDVYPDQDSDPRNDYDPGVFVIARITEKIVPSTAVADLAVVDQPAPAEVQMPANLSLNVAVKNNGPQTATEVGLKFQLTSGMVVSTTPTQGTCKQISYWLYCKLGQVEVGRSAKVTLVVKPLPDFQGTYETYVDVGAKEADNNPENNHGVAIAHARLDPNLPPEVTLEGPSEQIVEQGSRLVFKATATDRDGSISKVEFLDDPRILGTGVMTDAGHFSLSSDQLTNGHHVIFAMATDNAGRRSLSHPRHIFVNGPIKIGIVEPIGGSVIAPGSDLTLIAEATNPSGAIKSVEFFQVGISMGLATPVGDNRFVLKVRNIPRARYSIEAIAISDSGAVSKTQEFELKVSNPPTVKIISPVEGATVQTRLMIQLSFSSESYDSMERVEVYANGVLIEQGGVMMPGKYGFNWRDVAPGKYTLKAVVIDGVGARGESLPVNIVIKGP